MLDERLRFGLAGSLTSVGGVMPPAHHQMRLFNKRKIAASVPQLHEILNSYTEKSFIPCNKITLSTHHHLRSFILFPTLLETPCRFFGDHTFRFWASI